MTISEYFSSLSYPGRVIISGTGRHGERVEAYAIMGRSKNSRNRIFRMEGTSLWTRPWDETKVSDPSLIIYRARAVFDKSVILTNGDHTETILEEMKKGGDLASAMTKRTYEPDEPNWTPRISLVESPSSYSISIIRKRGDEEERNIWNYTRLPGFCHAIHTYDDDGNPLPSFSSSPVLLTLPETHEAFTEELWNALDKDNRISLFTSWNDKGAIINSREKEESISLKYGLNPNQKNASISRTGGLPLTVLNGRPGYINFLDALNGWQLVKELRAATGLDAAASFKHVSPAGAAVAVPLSEAERKMYMCSTNKQYSPLATAYIRARGADRMSSFGDFIALSSPCDRDTAEIIRKEVSDGIIAPGYSEEALEILKAKKNGAYCVILIDPSYVPEKEEKRSVFGITFREDHNDYEVSDATFSNPVTVEKEIPEDGRLDMTVAMVALKYTQSNSVIYAKNGQTIGVGAGQQSRIHCTRLAGEKADKWWMRQHPAILALPFRKDISRNEKDNIIEQYLSENAEINVFDEWEKYFTSPVSPLPLFARKEWMDKLEGVSLSSDAFFPFRDNIDRAARSGVRYITEPGGSVRDDLVIEAADEHGMAMFFTSSRLFHH